MRRITSEERRHELADYSGKLLSPIGATFAFLIGFAATMTWSGMSARQQAVDLQATSAQQLVWATKSISDKAAAAQIVANLHTFLDTEVTQDVSYLARGDTTDLPSAKAYDTLQDSVHQVAYRAGTTVPEAGAMTSAAAVLTGARAELSAVAQRELPWLLTGLIIVAGALLTLAIGAASVAVYRPYLMYRWAFVSSIAVTLIFSMDAPFGGAITVNLGPLEQLANSL